MGLGWRKTSIPRTRMEGRASLFVVLEGFDRVGKNTQMKLLLDRLSEAGYSARGFTTPDYGSATGKLIDEQLAKGSGGDVSSVVLQAFMTANRCEVAGKIARALEHGEIVVCVRWRPSALVYGEVDGVDLPALLDACSVLPEPDLYVLLDAGVEQVVGKLDRSKRYEGDFAKSTKIVEGYRRWWRSKITRSAMSGEGPRWVVVPAAREPSEVAVDVWQAVRRLLYRVTRGG